MKRLWVIGAVLLVAGVAAGALLLLRTPEPHGPLVVVDAGHGGSFSANTGVGGLREADVNLAIAKRLRKQLIGRGYRVIMTRTTDTQVSEKAIPTWSDVGSPSRTWSYGLNKTLTARREALQSDLQARVDIANRAGADVFVSVHNNASKNTAARGSETYAYQGDAPGMALAASVQDAVVARTGNENRGAHGSRLYVVRWTNMPAVLVEGAYFTNELDAEALKSSRFQDRIAEGIADGIDRWRVSYPPRATEPQLSGDDPASLACAVSSAAYPAGSKVVVILPAENPALGPSAATLAATLGGPLLLASASGVSTQTAAELRRLKAPRTIVVGDASSSDVARLGAAVAAASGTSAPPEVLTAPTAAGTAAKAAGSIPLPPSGEVAVADVSDGGALTALAPYSAVARVPVLLSEGGRLGAEARAYLDANRTRIKRVLVVGSAVSPTAPSGWPITTLRRADPDQLAALLMARAFPSGAKTVHIPGVVDAANAADVFTAAAEAARRTQPLVQVRTGILSPFAREFLVNRSASVGGFLVLRDAGSVPPVTESALRKSVGR